MQAERLSKGESEMPRRKIVDHSKLVKMVQEGAAQAEIMKKFGYGTSTQLKVAYANALIQTGQAPAIKGGRKVERKGKKKVKLVKVGKRGSIIIPADVVAEMKIGKADKFTVRKSKSGISIKKEI
jgi:hypothetical protein